MSNGLHCHVAYCRHPTTHNTSDHRCGNCWGFGHGVVECENWAKKRDLAATAATQAPQSIKTCNVPGCRKPYTHTTDAHHCPSCRQRCDADHDCPIHTVHSTLSNVELVRAADALPGAQSFTIVDDPIPGSLPNVFVRRDGLFGKTESLRAGTASPAVEEWFTKDRLYLSPPPVSPTSFSSTPDGDGCPVCRAPVPRPGGVIEVYGAALGGNCSVCLSEPATHIFTACGHAVICGECANHWK